MFPMAILVHQHFRINSILKEKKTFDLRFWVKIDFHELNAMQNTSMHAHTHNNKIWPNEFIIHLLNYCIFWHLHQTKIKKEEKKWELFVSKMHL